MTSISFRAKCKLLSKASKSSHDPATAGISPPHTLHSSHLEAQSLLRVSSAAAVHQALHKATPLPEHSPPLFEPQTQLQCGVLSKDFPHSFIHLCRESLLKSTMCQHFPSGGKSDPDIGWYSLLCATSLCSFILCIRKLRSREGR